MATYYITDDCIECNACKPECQQNAISQGSPYTIDENKCNGCGNCVPYCPINCIVKDSGQPSLP